MKGKSFQVKFKASNRREVLMSEPVGIKDLDAFLFDLNRAEWVSLMGKLEARAKFLREGVKGKMLTDSARRKLIGQFRLNIKGDVAYVCVLIALLRAAKVRAVRKDLIQLITTLEGPNCETVGQFAAHALWEFGCRSKLIAPFISQILATEMSRQVETLMVFFQRS